MILSKYFAQYNNETDLKFYNLVEDKKSVLRLHERALNSCF